MSWPHAYNVQVRTYETEPLFVRRAAERAGMGANAATLSSLSDANLAGLTKLDGGMGVDQLTFDNTQAGNLSRFVNWETIDATNGSRLALDANGLTLGDSGTGTGVLDIDATSTLQLAGPAVSAIRHGPGCIRRTWRSPWTSIVTTSRSASRWRTAGRWVASNARPELSAVSCQAACCQSIGAR